MEPTRPIMIPFDQSIFREISDDTVDQRMLLEQLHYRQQYELARKQELEKMLFLQSAAFRAATEPGLTFIQQPQRPPVGSENFLLGNGSPFSEKVPLLSKHEGLEADFERRLSSSRVKLKLKECLLTRRQQQGSTTSPPQAQPVPQWTSIDSQASPPQACLLSYPLAGSNHKGFPIRKTSSEPNLKVKSALKQKVIDRRSSPLLKRQQHKTFASGGGSQGNSLNSPVSSCNEEPVALEAALSSLGNYAAQAGSFNLTPDDLTSHTSLPNLNNCRLAQNSTNTASDGDSGSVDLTSSDASGENLPKDGRRPNPHCLNRASSSPLLIRDPCGSNSMQIAVQEQKMLVKKHLRQKVLTKNLLSESDKSSPPIPASNRPAVNFRACLERTASSPIMKLPSPIKEERSHEFSFSTALVYDPGMLSHQCLCGTEENHPENPARLAAIWQRMQDAKLVSRCDKVRGRKASLHVSLCDLFVSLCRSLPIVRAVKNLRNAIW